MPRLLLCLIIVLYLLSVTAVTSHDSTPTPVSDATLGHSFRNHVMPVLTKMGCNSGPCHGAAAGKNGFALSLRGYDPDADYDTLTKQAAGRRINQQEPARSLILLKPTETVPHMGGKRFERDSPEYHVLASWIAAGAPRPTADDPTLVRLEVQPARQRADVGTHLDLRVIAHYSNSTAEDVTRWAKYSTTDESVAQVDAHGAVAIKGHGEAAINVAFLTSLASARVASAFPNDVPEAVFNNVPQDTLIDRLIVQKLRDLHIAPSPPASDVTFIRRAWLDATGVLPSPADVDQFVSDPAPDKRTRLIDQLLSRPEFIDYWTYQWSDLLLVSSNSLGPK